jgi:hypothetical protein
MMEVNYACPLQTTSLHLTSQFLIKEHLLSRHVDLSRYRTIFYQSEPEPLVCFVCYNLSGKLTGYQQYRPLADKEQHNDEKYGRYHTYVTDEGEKGRAKKSLNVWGLETFYYRSDILFITEGVFDSVRLHNLNLPSIAVFTNDPKPLRSFLFSIGRKIICVCDGDPSGKKLEKFGQTVITCPEGYDLGKMTNENITNLVVSFVK